MEREKAKMKPSGSPIAALNPADLNGRATPSGFHHHDDGRDEPVSSTRSRPDGAVSDTAHAAADDAESVGGDTLHAVGSASSHASSSSVFSSSATLQTSGPATKPHSTSLTPLTTIDSPSYKEPALITKAQSLTPRHADHVNGSVSNASMTSNGSSTPLPVLPGVAERPAARDPARSVRGVKCIYDPLLDRSTSSSDKKKSKAQYKEFGVVRIIHTISDTAWRGGVILSTKAFG